VACSPILACYIFFDLTFPDGVESKGPCDGSVSIFWLSLVLILGCLLLCLQERKSMVPFRYEGIEPWGMAVPLASALLTLGVVLAFWVKLSIESLVIMFALVFAIATAFYFLFQLNR